MTVSRCKCHEALFPALSSPPRLLCRSPGPVPSVSSLSCPKPSLPWVMQPTLAHTTALTASYTPVSPTDTAGTHSHFTHAQAQPHQSTALLRMGKGYHLVTQVASGSPLHSAPPNACRAPPHDSTPTASFDVSLEVLERGYPLAALGSEDWCDAIHAGMFSGGRPSVHGVAPSPTAPASSRVSRE